MLSLLAEKLKRYRKRKFPDDGLRVAAGKIGVSFSHLNKVERGLLPSQDMLKKLMEAYDLSDDEKIELVRYTGKPLEYPEIADFLNEYLKQNPSAIKNFYFRKAKFENDDTDQSKN